VTIVSFIGIFRAAGNMELSTSSPDNLHIMEVSLLLNVHSASEEIGGDQNSFPEVLELLTPRVRKNYLQSIFNRYNFT